MLDSISDGVLILDRAWCITYANNNAIELVSAQRHVDLSDVARKEIKEAVAFVRPV